MSHSPLLHGIDFTSAPRRAKAITVASGRLTAPADRRRGASSAVDEGQPTELRIESLARLESFAEFEAWLRRPGPWVAGFDLPFGLPRGLMADWGWCAATPAGDGDPGWPRIIDRVAALSRRELVSRLRAYCEARPPGNKFAHRDTDRPAGSSPSMKWINPPVALMLHAGAPLLYRAGLHLPGLTMSGDPTRVGLEAYPGLVARSLVGRASYKSDDKARQDSARADVRARLVAALEAGASADAAPVPPLPDGPAFRLSQPVSLSPAVRGACLDDASGDALDAVLCVVLAAWGWQRREAGWGLPALVDPLEGWIVGA